MLRIIKPTISVLLKAVWAREKANWLQVFTWKKVKAVCSSHMLKKKVQREAPVRKSVIILMAMQVLKSCFFHLNCLKGGSVGQIFLDENKGAIMHLKFGQVVYL